MARQTKVKQDTLSENDRRLVDAAATDMAGAAMHPFSRQVVVDVIAALLTGIGRPAVSDEWHRITGQ